MTKRERFEQLVKQLVDSGFSTKLAISVASKTLDSEQVKVERGENESLQQCVNRGISKLMNEGMNQDQAIAAAYSMCQIEPKAYNPDQQRDSHGRFAGSAGSHEPSSAKPRDGSNGRKPPSGEITTEGETPITVEGDAERDKPQDETEVKPGDRMDNGKKPSSGTYGRPDKKPK